MPTSLGYMAEAILGIMESQGLLHLTSLSARLGEGYLQGTSRFLAQGGGF